MFKSPVPVNPGVLSSLQLAAQPEGSVALQVTCPTQVPPRQDPDAERSCSGSTGGDPPLAPSPQNAPTAAAPPRTKADLIRLMEETSEEMQRAKTLLLGYQEASRQHGALVGSPRGGPGSPKGLLCGSPRLAPPQALSHTSVARCVIPKVGHSGPRSSVDVPPASTSTGPSTQPCGLSTSTSTGVPDANYHIGDPSLKLSTVMSSTHISPRGQSAVPAAPEPECTSA